MKESRLIYREVGKFFDLQVVGGGPGGMGIFVAGASQGKLDHLLNSPEGVALIEADSGKLGQGAFRDYRLNSNSGPGDFLEAFHRGDLADVVQTEIGRKFMDYAERRLNVISLQDVANLQAEIAERVRAAFERSGSSRIFTRKVGHVQQLSDELGAFYVSHETGSDEVIAASRRIILATGAVQSPTLELGENSGKRVLSDEIIKEGPGFGEIIETFRARPDARVVVVGASHSGFSAAVKILQELDARSVKIIGSVEVLAKDGVRVFFDNEGEAGEVNYDFDEPLDVCQETRRVNRFGGLRGDAKDLYFKILDGRESRVKIVDLAGVRDLGEVYDKSDFIIQAIGYGANRVPILDASGREIGPGFDSGGKSVFVDDECRLHDSGGVALPVAWGIGIGHGIKPWAGLGGEKAFKGDLDAVNLYQTLVGKKIFEQVLTSIFNNQKNA